ncbi:MAG: hypothetical protein Kilf2KO_00750 [Rhodospirillales bacterium]
MMIASPTATATRPDARLPRLLLILASAWMALALLGGLSTVNPAFGQSLKAELANGTVGERYDGFLEARNSSARGLVNSVNAKRRALYEKRAKELGQSVAVVGKVYAGEIYERARSGTWFLSQNQTWSQKP